MEANISKFLNVRSLEPFSSYLDIKQLIFKIPWKAKSFNRFLRIKIFHVFLRVFFINEQTFVIHGYVSGETNYRFASMVNDNFKMIMSMQFLISTGAVCFNLYRLSVMEFGPKFMETATYTLCLLMQVFYYCWYGNEVKLKVRFTCDIMILPEAEICEILQFQIFPFYRAWKFLTRCWKVIYHF